MQTRNRPARLGSRRQRGQTLIVVALMAVVLFGFAGLALDAGHIFLVHRMAQNTADAAALAAGKKLSGGLRKSQPASQSDQAVKAVHDVAQTNGFPTTYPSACDSTVANTPTTGLTQFRTSWYDVTVPCGQATGWTTRVDVYSPPQTLVADCVNAPYNCLQVVITQNVQNYIMGVLGQPITTISTLASVYAQPAGQVFGVPPPVAIYLYEPQLSCAPSAQCFNETKAPTRANLTCDALTANCPTFWVQTGTNPTFAGIDGQRLASPLDWVALQSKGDMVLLDPTTICDPFGGVTCTKGVSTGTKGFAIAPGTPSPPPTLYCSSFIAPGTPGGFTPCTTAGPGGTAPKTIASNETNFTAPTWTNPFTLPSLPNCQYLVLSGGTVASSLPAGADPRCSPVGAANQYTILPGIYQYIVVNHGAYDFEAGLYDITGKAPNNSATTGWANGIDHSGETAADWDLCTGAVSTNPLSCQTVSTLTAGVWIGHASIADGLSVGPFSGSASIPCNGGAVLPISGGGGDPTRVTGNGVSFRFEPTSAGLVSTHEVDFIGIVGPGLGQQLAWAGVPILFDMENNGFIHLDADGDDVSSYFKGIIYQRQDATAGGVELNAGLANLEFNAAISGQVWAYSLTTFGTPGRAVDFSQGLGGTGTPVLTTAGGEEPEILFSSSYTYNTVTGRGQLTVLYDDEWALDAYDAYVRVNNGAPIFFSEGIWVPYPPTSATLPPNPNNGGASPSDVNPARPTTVGDPTQNPRGWYTNGPGNVAGKPDWIMNWPTPRSDWFRITGDWVWGHEQMITGASSGSDSATLIYNFAAPATSTVTITLFMSDGDSCGDFVTATWTFPNNPGGGPGPQDGGSVTLVQ